MEDQNTNKIKKILNITGPRDKPSEAMRNEVHLEVHKLWQSTYKKSWIKTHGYKVAASIFMMLTLFIIIDLKDLDDVNLTIASDIEIQGQVHVSDDDKNWFYLSSAESLRPNLFLKTQENNRLLIDLDSGITLKVDELTYLKFTSKNQLELKYGRIYIDSNDTSIKNHLSVIVDSVEISHIGTQYSISNNPDNLQVSVRDGIVKIKSPQGQSQVNEGNKVNLTSDGMLQYSQISIHDEQWDWTQEIYRVFDIKGQSVEQYLKWVSSETGHEISWESMNAKIRAKNVILSGSIDGIPPLESLKIIIPTTNFHASVNDQKIHIKVVDG